MPEAPVTQRIFTPDPNPTSCRRLFNEAQEPNGLVSDWTRHGSVLLGSRSAWDGRKIARLQTERNPENANLQKSLPRATLQSMDDLTAADIERMAGERGMTMPQVCETIGIAYTTFWRWKAARGEPSLSVYRRLRDAVSLKPQPKARNDQSPG